MKKPAVVLLIAASALLGGCASSRLVYPVIPAEDTAPRILSFESGYRAENGIGVPKDYAAAKAAYSAAAQAGDVRAMNNLGVMAMQGRGGRVDPAEARRHFRRAAEAGSANGHYNLGLLFETGLGGAPDLVAAAYEYRMAAEMGHAMAQYRLARMLESGHGVPKSLTEARRLYEMAAVRGDRASAVRLEALNGTVRNLGPSSASSLLAVDHCDCRLAPEKAMAARGIESLKALAASGDAPARYNLGVRLLKGEASNQDPSEAARLFTLAARQGYAPAQRQLAHMHLRGQAVAKSKVLAHAWLNLAARQDTAEGRAARSEMESLEVTMTLDEIAEAQRIAVSGALKGR